MIEWSESEHALVLGHNYMPACMKILGHNMQELLEWDHAIKI